MKIMTTSMSEDFSLLVPFLLVTYPRFFSVALPWLLRGPLLSWLFRGCFMALALANFTRTRSKQQNIS